MAILFLGPLIGCVAIAPFQAIGSLFDGDPGTGPGEIIGTAILLALEGFGYMLPVVFLAGWPGSAVATIAFALVRPFIRSRWLLVLFCLLMGFFATSLAWTIYQGADLLLGLVTGADMSVSSPFPTDLLSDVRGYILTFGLPGALALLVTGTARTA